PRGPGKRGRGNPAAAALRWRSRAAAGILEAWAQEPGPRGTCHAGDELRLPPVRDTAEDHPDVSAVGPVSAVQLPLQRPGGTRVAAQLRRRPPRPGPARGGAGRAGPPRAAARTCAGTAVRR